MRAKLLILAALAALAPAANAQDCGTPAAMQALESSLLTSLGYDKTLSAIQKCLGSESGDDASVVQNFAAQTADVKAAGARRTNVRDALQSLEDFAAAKGAASPNPAPWALARVQLADELVTLHALPNIAAPKDRLLAPAFWPDAQSPGGVAARGEVTLLGPLGCAPPPAACPAYEDRKDLIRVFHLANRLGKYADADSLKAQLADAEAQNTRWTSYFHDARPQFWWEVLLNGAVMKKSDCADDPATHIQRGFCRVPSSQWILLHPAPALQWVNGAKSESDLEPAFAVELLGHNSWGWSGSNTVTGLKGWALLGAYSNRGKDRKKWSYGLMLHYGKDINLGLTTTADSEFGILLSTRLAGRFFEQRKAYEDYLKSQEKGSWLELLD